jgi:hypothetical protein
MEIVSLLYGSKSWALNRKLNVPGQKAGGQLYVAKSSSTLLHIHKKLPNVLAEE